MTFRWNDPALFLELGILQSGRLDDFVIKRFNRVPLKFRIKSFRQLEVYLNIRFAVIDRDGLVDALQGHPPAADPVFFQKGGRR